MNARFFDNLQFKAAIVFLLLSIVPLGIVSVFAVQTANRVIESIVTNQLENVAAEKQELLQRWIAERKADLEVVAGSAPVRSLDPAQVKAYLDLVRQQYKVYKRFVVVGRQGQVIYDSLAGAEGIPNEQLCYRRALEGKPFMSEVSLDPVSRESVFYLAALISGPDGKPQGAVCAAVITAAIVQQVLNVSLGATGECYLVDKTGTFLVHKDPQRILRDNIADSESFTQIFQEDRPKPVYTDYRRIAVLGASRAVAGTQWYVVVEQDRDEAFARSYQLKRNIYIVIALTIAGAIGLSVLLAFYVTAPIRELGRAAEKLSRGDFENALAGVRITRRDEIGALHAAFAHMAGQLQDRHARLENRVGLTEAELQKADAKLRDTLRAAARSEHLAALGRLASGVAHEIRTPLTSLKLYLQSVIDDVTICPEHAEDFDVAMRQVERMESTISQFLDFARPQEPVLAEIDFDKLVGDTLALVRPRAVHQEVEVDVSIAPELPRVEGDARQLGEAIVNLLVNALEEMPDGGRLHVSVQPETGNPQGSQQPWVRIELTDTGPGIQEEDFERLFEPFFTTKASGSGLGLAIVRGTVQRHRGIVRVRSDPEAGTTFSVFLPAAARQSRGKHGQNPDRG